MTEEQRKLGRRNFLKAASTLPFTGALVYKAISAHPVRTALIGAGSQGLVLLKQAPATHMRMVAVCDIFPEHSNQGLEFVRRTHDSRAEGYQDYRKVLERDDIEAVLVAVPLKFHEEVTVAAFRAGKHVLCEKTLAHDVAGCRSMIEASLKARRNLQVGHQRTYNPLYLEAKQLIDQGLIGDIYHVRAVWHRNHDWRRRVPQSDFDPSPWGYPDLEHLINWRMYWQYSQGLMAELGSHQLQVVNWFSGRVPQTVYASGGVYRFPDGREVPDHVYAIYEYPGHLTLSYSTILSNTHDHYYEQIMGTKGTIILRREREAFLFFEGEAEGETELTMQRSGSDPVLQASESRLADAAGQAVDTSSQATALNPYRLEMEGFCSTIRNGAPNRCDGPTGMNACVAILKANESIQKGEKLDLPPNLFFSS